MNRLRNGLLIALTMMAALPATAAAFELKDGDHVVFLGDTMTFQRVYTDLVESFVRVRYPKLDVRFFAAGQNMETAALGLARVQRDVLSLDPPATVVVVSYGLYDPQFAAFDQIRYDAYVKALDGIVAKLRAAKCRVWVVTPLSVDEDRNPRLANAQYNEVLGRYADGASEVAKKHAASVLDYYKLSLDGRAAERKLNRRFTYTTRGYDANFVASGLLAAELLKAWKAEPIAADITLDWKTKEATITSGTLVVEKRGDNEVTLKLTDVPMLWPYQPDRRSAPVNWPLGALSHMTLTVKNSPQTGVMLEGDARGLPLLNIQLEMGVNLARHDPVRSLEPLALLARLVNMKNLIRSRDLWANLQRQPQPRAELRKARKANEDALMLYVLGYRDWINNVPNTFGVDLPLKAIIIPGSPDAAPAPKPE